MKIFKIVIRGESFIVNLDAKVIVNEKNHSKSRMLDVYEVEYFKEIARLRGIIFT
jgi:hypothetical protein